MRIRKLSALLLSLAMLLGLLAGCGGGDEAEITAEDFYGCWEYADYDMWVCFYDDGTFEWYSDGLDSTGTYSMDGVELYLDGLGLTVSLDGEGNLIDSDGEVLFLSELPDFYYNYGWDDEEDDDWDDGDYGSTVSSDDFVGCWEYTDTYTWVYIYGDGTYEWYDSEGLEVMGNYYMFGDELCLEDSGMSFTLDGSGGLVDAFGDTLFLSELPQW